MFGLVKWIFYTGVAIVVGILIGTVPVGGRTMAERIQEIYRSFSAEPASSERKERGRVANKRTRDRETSESKKEVRASTGLGRKLSVKANENRSPQISPGAANTPEKRTSADKAALDRIILSKTDGRD